MNWKVWLAVGAAFGGAYWVRRRRAQQALTEGSLWAEATDPVARFGDA
ncbi:MAG TPA: DLW-39 family protein [Microlunatus sp.]